MIELKTPTEIARMQVAGRFVADVLAELSGLAAVGVNLLDLEHHVRGRIIARRGARSCYWDYAPSFGRGPFRNVICLSVNDAALHGLPATRSCGTVTCSAWTWPSTSTAGSPTRR